MIRIPQELWEEAELTRKELGRRLGFKLSLNDFILHQLKKAIDEGKNQLVVGPGSSLCDPGKGKKVLPPVFEAACAGCFCGWGLTCRRQTYGKGGKENGKEAQA